MKSFKTVDDYIENARRWKDELAQLRKILLDTGLSEEVKWGGPIYTYKGKNIAGIAGFKSYFGLWFHQGALLKDHRKKLINAQEGVTKALRQWRFSSAKEIDAKTIKAYVKEAIRNAEAGKEIKPVKKKEAIVSKELNKALKINPKALKQFQQFTDAKKREYAEYIEEAAMLETKQRRLEKIIPMIIQGKGLNDKYK